MRWTASILGICSLGLSACDVGESPTEWNFVGVYDASALVAAVPPVEGEEGPTGMEYVWVPAGGMSGSCGPAKSPDGLGVFEAEAVANRLSPTLAILLERNGAGAGPMTPADVRVSLGIDEPVYQFQPAVMPRYVSVRIDGDADLAYKQQVRTQIEMELCMEHKAGRGWIGGDRTQLRQAFLLAPPESGEIDRKYFGGQRDPVPALLGPPDACLRQAEELEAKAAGAGRGDGSLNLVPSDVWGASLRWCDLVEVGGSEFIGPKPVHLTVGETVHQPKRTQDARWKELHATLHDADAELDIKVDLAWNEQALLTEYPLFNQPVDDDGNPVGPPGLTDLLQRIPHEYPVTGTVDDPERFTVLLIPGWQVVEGLRRLEAGDAKNPVRSAGDGVQDGVGFLIDNPEYLFVQLPPKDGEEVAEGEDEIWLNVAEPLAGGPLGINRWGYSPGMLSGRAPIVLPGPEAPTWQQVMWAHNTGLHAAFLGAFVMLISLLLLGIGRLGDLWANIPEERVDFWPSPDGSPPEESGGDAPELPKAE